VKRKPCAQCGQENLSGDEKCWACGSAHFAAPGAPAPGDVTLAYAAPFPLSSPEETISWSNGRRFSGKLQYAAAAIGAALAIGSVGYWLGRSSAVPPPDPSPAPLPSADATRAPIDLPQPPQAMASFGSFPSGSSPSGASNEPPTVIIRPGVRQQAPALPMPAAPPSAAPFRPPDFRLTPLARPSAPAHQPAEVVQAPVMPAPDPAVQTLRPTDTTAVVSFRNDAPTPVRVTVEGNGSRMAMIGAGSVFPLSLSPGTYVINAAAGGLSTGPSTLILGATRSYTLVISRHRDDGKDALVLVEPELVGE